MAVIGICFVSVYQVRQGLLSGEVPLDTHSPRGRQLSAQSRDLRVLLGGFPGAAEEIRRSDQKKMGGSIAVASDETELYGSVVI